MARTTVCGSTLLPRGGMSFLYPVPPNLSGASVILQAVALAPSANMGNAFFTTPHGHEVQFQALLDIATLTSRLMG